MKEETYIENLRSKYWAAETSLEEEKILKDHFKDLTNTKSPESALFAFIQKEQAITYSKTIALPKKRKSKWTKLLSIAAIGIILISSWFVLSYDSHSDNKVIIEDPEVALEITKEAFALLNGKMVKSKDLIKENIIHLEKTFIFKNL